MTIRYVLGLCEKRKRAREKKSLVFTRSAKEPRKAPASEAPQHITALSSRWVGLKLERSMTVSDTPSAESQTILGQVTYKTKQKLRHKLNSELMLFSP